MISFTEADTALTAAALRCYAVGMLFMAANEVLTKAFFAESRPRLPMYASLGAMAANVVLVNLLAPMGIGGIALASGLASGVQFVLNVIFWRRHTGAWIPASDFLDMGRSVLSALVMGAALLLLPVSIAPVSQMFSSKILITLSISGFSTSSVSSLPDMSSLVNRSFCTILPADFASLALPFGMAPGVKGILCPKSLFSS